MLIPHNHHNKNLASQTTYPQTGWQDLQPGASQTYSSKASREKLCKVEGNPPDEG